MAQPTNGDEQKNPSSSPAHNAAPAQQFAPPSGSQTPQYGQQAPQYGQQAPQYGQQAPQYGQQAPQYGQQAPQYGQQAPQYGAPPMGYGNFKQSLKPGIIPLKPLSLGEIYDGAFSAVRRAPGSLLGLVAVVVSVFVVLAGVFGYILAPWINSTKFGREFSSLAVEIEGFEGFGTAGFLGITSLISVAMVLATALSTGIVVVAIGQLVINRSVKPGQVWDRVRPRAWALVGVAVLPALVLTLIVFAATFLAIFLATLVADVNAMGLLLVLYFIALAIFFVYFAVKLVYAPAILILEERKIFDSVKRSFAITKGSFWRTLGIYILTSIILNFTLSVVGQILMTVVGAVAGENIDTSVIALSGWIVVQIIINILSVALLSAVVTIMYIDLRMRKEGLDIELLAAAEKAS